MSRSYKKNPVVTDNYGKRGRNKKKYGKRLSNQRFRRHIGLDDDMPARPQYKKYTESWDIYDYKIRMTKEEAIEQYNYIIHHNPSLKFMRRYPTLESWLKFWEKCYRRK